MDLVTEYAKFTELIDRCTSAEEIKTYQNQKNVSAMRSEFWAQRKLFLAVSDPVKKQAALAKLQWLQHFFGCRIPIRRAINQFQAPGGLYGIFISSEASVGTGCVIFPHVSIESDTFPDSERAGFPVVGNNVFISSGVRIMGGVTIGDHVRIGPNCCITEDIPSNCIVSAGAPVIALQDTPPDNRHLSPAQFLDLRYSRVIYDHAAHADSHQLRTEKAAPGEIDQIIQLYKDRIAWFRHKRIPQWGHYLEHHPREEFLQKIAAGEYYVIKLGSEIIGGFALSNDSENWMDDSPNAYYVSRGVIKVGCKNLSGYLMAEAKKLTLAAGKELLRLECVHDNTQLNQLWECQGFAYVRDHEGSYHAALREWDSRSVQTQ